MAPNTPSPAKQRRVRPLSAPFAELVRVPLHRVAKKRRLCCSEADALFALVLPGVTVTQLLDQRGFEPSQSC